MLFVTDKDHKAYTSLLTVTYELLYIKNSRISYGL